MDKRRSLFWQSKKYWWKMGFRRYSTVYWLFYIQKTQVLTKQKGFAEFIV